MPREKCANGFDFVEAFDFTIDEDSFADTRWRVLISIAGEPASYEAWHDAETFTAARDEAIARCRGWIRALQKLRVRDAA